jgi:DNA-binding MarR family transcriptional regulator
MGMDSTLARGLDDLAFAVMKNLKAEFRADVSAGLPTMTQFRMLHCIRKGHGRVGRIAEEFGISQPAASIMVDAMVREGLLKRTPHPADRRQIELRVTPKAAARIDAIRRRALARLDARLARLPAARRRDLARGVREVVAILSAEPA